MLEETVNDYSPYLKLDINEELSGVQSVIDNMLTRLEEFESVLNMIKSKNDDCRAEIFNDIRAYKAEVTVLSKKIDTLEVIVSSAKNNIDLLESHIQKAEADFGICTENKLKKILRPFFSQNKEAGSAPPVATTVQLLQLESMQGYFRKNP